MEYTTRRTTIHFILSLFRLVPYLPYRIIWLSSGFVSYCFPKILSRKEYFDIVVRFVPQIYQIIYFVHTVQQNGQLSKENLKNILRFYCFENFIGKNVLYRKGLSNAKISTIWTCYTALENGSFNKFIRKSESFVLVYRLIFFVLLPSLVRLVVYA